MTKLRQDALSLLEEVPVQLDDENELAAYREEKYGRFCCK